jgi:uncharacterized protein with von Willebrand factor type A (vWA) domain
VASELTKDQLWDMLNLSGPDPADAPKLEVTEAEIDESQKLRKGKNAERSDTVIKTDSWDRAKGTELSLRAGDGEKHDKLGPAAWADFHAAAFNSAPELQEHVLDERRKEFVGEMLDSPEFQQVREKSVFSRINSEIAAETTAETWAKLVEADAKTQQKEADRKTPKGKQLTKQEYGRNLSRAVTQAARQAQSGIDQMDDIARGIGSGGGADGVTDVSGLRAVVAAARKDPQLMRVFELAGRYRRVAQSKQRVKFVHGPDEVVGVDLSSDLSRVLPVELARLADDDQEWDVLRRFAEGTLQSRESRVAENVGKGPVVVIVDESGSMAGDRIANAKGFALALAWVAKSQRRWCALVGFAGHNFSNRHGMTYQPEQFASVCVLRPDRWDEQELLKWLQHFYNGGTDPDTPLHDVPHHFWPKFVEQGMQRGKTDVVVITDGEIRVPDEMAEAYREWKKREEVRTITLTIGSQPGGLAGVSDEVHLIQSLTVADESVGQVLGI